MSNSASVSILPKTIVSYQGGPKKVEMEVDQTDRLMFSIAVVSPAGPDKSVRRADVQIDLRQLALVAYRASKNKTKKAVTGPIKVTVPKEGDRHASAAV